MGKPSKSKPLPSNGVPGPGAYSNDLSLRVPSFKICNATSLNDKQELLLKEQQSRPQVCPTSYNPVEPQAPVRGARIGTSERAEEFTTSRFTPAPNLYKIIGDFDFRDPSSLDRGSGKLAKFAYGIKTIIK